jgi:hypothetical protein
LVKKENMILTLKFHPADAALITQKRQMMAPIQNQIMGIYESMIAREGMTPTPGAPIKITREGADSIDVEVPDPPGPLKE